MPKFLAPLLALFRRPFLTPCAQCEAKGTMCPDCEALAGTSAYGDLPMRWPDGREEWPQRP